MASVLGQVLGGRSTHARDVFGPWKVNCHTLVGLGETDHDMIDMFVRLRDRQIFSYLFCFNPGGGLATRRAPQDADLADGVASNWPST